MGKFTMLAVSYAHAFYYNLLRIAKFHKSSNNSNVGLGIKDYKLSTRRVVLKNDYHEKQKDMLAYILAVE